MVKELVRREEPYVVVAAGRNPYDLLEFPEVKTYYACYENRPLAMVSLANVLLGKEKAVGRLPVTLSESIRLVGGWIMGKGEKEMTLEQDNKQDVFVKDNSNIGEEQDVFVREYFVGVDLGGTKMLAALVAYDGSIIAREEIPTLAQQGEVAVLDRLGNLIEGILAAVPGSRSALRGIGVATAGTLDTANGVVTFATNLGWRDVAVAAVLSDRFACEVRLENDATAAAVGEWLAGAGEGAPDCIFVTISTGIGGGIISGGRLIAGVNHNAGELGHHFH